MVIGYPSPPSIEISPRGRFYRKGWRTCPEAGAEFLLNTIPRPASAIGRQRARRCARHSQCTQRDAGGQAAIDPPAIVTQTVSACPSHRAAACLPSGSNLEGVFGNRLPDGATMDRCARNQKTAWPFTKIVGRPKDRWLPARCEILTGSAPRRFSSARPIGFSPLPSRSSRRSSPRRSRS